MSFTDESMKRYQTDLVRGFRPRHLFDVQDFHNHQIRLGFLSIKGHERDVFSACHTFESKSSRSIVINANLRA